MERSDLLKLVLSNVALDVLTPRVPQSVAKSIFAALNVAWSRVSVSGAGNLDALARSALDEVLAGAPDDSLCRGPEIKAGDVKISRVTDHLGFWQYNLEKSAFPSSDGGVPDEAFWTLVEQDPLMPEQVRNGSMVRGPRNFAWITTGATIDAIRDESDDKRPATHIRNYLGLDHFDIGAILLELEYPKDALAATRVAAPTFVEGGTKAVYRSVSADDGNLWGCAMRLEPIADGGAEAVHMAIPFTCDFRIRCLGSVKEEPPPIDVVAFMTRHPRPWQNGDEKLIAAQIAVEEA